MSEEVEEAAQWAKEIVSLQLRLPRHLHRQVIELAEKEMRSLNSQIVWILTKAVQSD